MLPHLVAIRQDRVEQVHHVGKQCRALLLATSLNAIGEELKLRALHALSAITVLLVVPLIDAASANVSSSVHQQCWEGGRV